MVPSIARFANCRTKRCSTMLTYLSIFISFPFVQVYPCSESIDLSDHLTGRRRQPCGRADSFSVSQALWSVWCTRCCEEISARARPGPRGPRRCSPGIGCVRVASGERLRRWVHQGVGDGGRRSLGMREGAARQCRRMGVVAGGMAGQGGERLG